MVNVIKYIYSNNDFKCLYMKDRFTPGCETDGGWRDAVIYGCFKMDLNQHVVEIQIHHKAMFQIRKNLGGHKIYKKYRHLKEALELNPINSNISQKSIVIKKGSNSIMRRRSSSGKKK